MRLAQSPQLIHLVTMRLCRNFQFGSFSSQRGGGLDRLRVRGLRPAGGRQQLRPHRRDPRQHIVAPTGRDLAQRRIERALQVVGGVLDRAVHILSRALLDPQQTRDAPVLLPTGALEGELKTEQFGQVILRIHTLEPSCADLQFAALLLQEALEQPVRRATDLEVEFDQGRRRRIAVRPQVVDAGRTVPLEEGRPDGTHQGALAGLVGYR